MESPALHRLSAHADRLAAAPAWLGGPARDSFAAAFAAARERIQKSEKSGSAVGPVVVACSQPAEFLAVVLAAVERGAAVALASPCWGETERAQAAAQIKPGIWFGDSAVRWPEVKPDVAYDAKQWAETILIPTGGTGGRVRWAIHAWDTLAAAARSLTTFLNARQCTHVSTLPLWHVSGLMPAVRALESGGRLWLEDWKTLEGGAPPGLPPERTVISLVPTQLQRLLPHGAVVDWLRGTKAILLGGAKPPVALLKKARELRLPIALAYGMTETAAVVAAQTPADFLADAPPHATPLPHAQIWVGDDAAVPLPIGEKGRVWIEAESLFHGYYPVRRAPGPLGTEDVGALDAQGRLQPLGRLDQIIITGGEKVNPAEVEKQIRASGLIKDVKVIGLPDAEWGERVVAIYTGEVRTEKELKAALRERLASHALPKAWIHAEQLPNAEKLK